MKQHLFILILAWMMAMPGFGQDSSFEESPRSLFSSYYNENFTPFKKGNYYVTLNMSLSSETLQNTTKSFVTIIDGKDSYYNIGVGTGYYFSDNFAGGIGFVFGESIFDGTLLRNNDTVQNNSVTTDFKLTPLLRSSIPLVPNQRLSVYIDMVIGVGWGSTVSRETKNNETVSKSYAHNFGFGVGVNPGLTFFVIQNFALEIGVNLVGYQYQQSKEVENDGPESISRSNDINFSIDLLQLQLALTYYIGTKN